MKMYDVPCTITSCKKGSMHPCICSATPPRDLCTPVFVVLLHPGISHPEDQFHEPNGWSQNIYQRSKLHGFKHLFRYELGEFDHCK